MGIELLNLVSPWKFAKIDHWAHLGGYAAGVVSGLALKWELEKQIQRRKTRLDKLVEDIGKRWGGN